MHAQIREMIEQNSYFGDVTEMELLLQKEEKGGLGELGFNQNMAEAYIYYWMVSNVEQWLRGRNLPTILSYISLFREWVYEEADETNYAQILIVARNMAQAAMNMAREAVFRTNFRNAGLQESLHSGLSTRSGI